VEKDFPILSNGKVTPPEKTLGNQSGIYKMHLKYFRHIKIDTTFD
jgi:hypothetical protein